MSASWVHVSEYMTAGPFAVGPREPLENAERLMKKYDVRHLPVWTDGELVGIVSDRDVHLVRALASGRPEVITVEQAMTPDPYAPSPDTPLVDVVRTMTERKLGSAVVLEGGRIVGIFTATDAMRALLDAFAGHVAVQSTFPGPSPTALSSRPSRRR
jgi:acetoin utilization protein AcuB